MNRRAFLAGSVGLLAAPLAVEAQLGGKGYRIGLLETGALRPRPWAAFKERMRELGYVEGQTAAFEPRWADGRHERLLRRPVPVRGPKRRPRALAEPTGLTRF